MSTSDDRALDALMRQVGRALERQDDALESQSEAHLRWLAAELRAGRSIAEREQDEQAAEAFARRTAQAMHVRRAELRLPRRELRHRMPPVVATASQAVAMANRERCAALLDLAAAAGEGRELWDEPCESWLELPAETPPGRVLALRVAGDSMVPVLRDNDVILVHLDDKPAIDDLVLARIGDGYVVKRLAAQAAGRIELASFNPAYSPIVGRDGHVILLGVLVARFSRPG